jgi:hypothetical protein
LNFDASPTLRFERIPIVGRLYTKNERRFPRNVLYGDVVRGLPIPPESCQGIYCSHVLEHLALDDLDLALSNTFSYLEKGGCFRLVVPDLERLARTYLADDSAIASIRFMEDSCLGTTRRRRGVVEFLTEWLGSSRHLWMWDERSLGSKLREHGFVDVRRAGFGDADDPRFTEVEDRARFEGCLGMQCRK